MGYQELIASLCKEADNAILSLRDDAGREIEKIRAETSVKIRRKIEQIEKIKERSVLDLESEIVSGARDQARTIRLSAEKLLAERLFSSAVSLLRELRDRDHIAVFRSLVNELPTLKLDELGVHPADAYLAGELVKDVPVRADEGISGGYTAVAEMGTVHIDNTFEKRLERAFEGLLPLMIRDLYGEISGHETASDA